MVVSPTAIPAFTRQKQREAPAEETAMEAASAFRLGSSVTRVSAVGGRGHTNLTRPNVLEGEGQRFNGVES
jgi:hypothetical protein